MRPDALLFDFDGVLADTERVHHASWNAVLEPLGIQFTWDEYLKQCVGIADLMVAQRLKLRNRSKHRGSGEPHSIHID
jgi:beta-phosphoglucomutase